MTTTGDAIVAVATGQAVPRPADRQSNASIVAAVAQARALATPRALINAQVQANSIAAASGLTLGPVVSVSQDTSNGLFSFYYSQLVSQLGPNRFCGPVTRSVVRRTNGKRTVVKRTTKRCDVPSLRDDHPGRHLLGESPLRRLPPAPPDPARSQRRSP